MTPASVSAGGETSKHVSFGCSTRFVVGFALGLLWLLPAWSHPQLIVGLLIWDAAVVFVWCIDLLWLPAPQILRAQRIWSRTLTLAEQTGVTIRLASQGGASFSVEIVEQLPSSLSNQPSVLRARLEPHGSVDVGYTVTPRERGDQTIGRLFLRYRSALGLAERWATVPLEQNVCVYPAALGSREQALFLIRSRQIDLQKRQRRQPGMGREFESLREYREGDEMRDVSWTATARSRQLISRIYTAERSQTVWVMVDAGRLLGAQVRPAAVQDSRSSQAKLDYAVNAAVSVVSVAIEHGDQAGLLVYGRALQAAVAPGRGSAQIRRVSEALAQARVEPNEANHGKAARMLMKRQSRRALVVWITDFAETAAVPEVIEYAAYLGKRHLVLVGAIGQPDLDLMAHTTPQTESDMFRHAAALEIAGRRDLLLRNLRQTGALALELVPRKSVSPLVNEYLRIKDRNLL